MSSDCSKPVLVVILLILLGGSWAAQTPTPTPLDELRDLLAQGEFPEAEAGARELLETIVTEQGPESLAAGEVLDILVESLWRTGRAQESETGDLARRALAIKEADPETEGGSLGRSLHNLAVVSFFLGDYAAARPLWERAADVRERALGPDHPDVGESLNALGNLLNTIGDYEAARPLYERAAVIREAVYGPDHPRVAQTLNNLGSMLTETGDYVEALPLIERAIEIKENAFGAESPQVAFSLTNLADVLDLTGEYDRAQELLERAVAGLEAAFGAENPYVGAALNNLAHHYETVGQPDLALPLYERALAVWEAALGPEHPRVAIGLDNLGALLAETGDFVRARELQQRAVTIRETALGPEHPELAESLDHLGSLLTTIGDYDAARPLLERAVTIQETSLGETHPHVARTQAHLALLEARTGHTDAALELALSAERIGREHLRLTGRALAEEQALRYASVRTGGLDLALSLAGSAATEAGRAVLDELIRSRAVVLDAMAARHRAATRSADPEVARLAAELASARTLLANLSVKGLGDLTPELYRELLGQARGDRDQAERALAAASGDFALEQERNRLGLDEVARSLPQHSALVAFALYEKLDVAPRSKTRPGESEPPVTTLDPIPSYAAIVLRDGATEPTVVPLGDAARIDEQIDLWKHEASRGALSIRRTAEEAEQRYRAAGTPLRQSIWDPLATAIGKVQRVFVVPDGALNLVSLASLPAGQKTYLIEKGPLVHYLSAERDLVPVGDRPPAGSGLLALGGPNYDETSLFARLGDAAGPTGAGGVPANGSGSDGTRASCGTFDTLRFKPLPAAGEEVREVAGLWRDANGEADGSVTELSGSAAGEAQFKREAAGRRVLHLATHGFFLGGDCAGSGGTRGLSIATDEPEATPVVGLSPLLLSGLALAGANHRAAAGPGEEDGILTAEEIAGLDLAGTEWAVLSACDTGVGEIRAGEGVFGLRRAMQLAGVRTLIMSLWPVDDQATRSWMLALYGARLSQGLDSAEAVRTAGLSVLESRREADESTHPFYWAAFVGAGDWH